MINITVKQEIQKLKFTKAKIIAAGVILAGICMITPQQLRAEVPEAQMDGVMGAKHQRRDG